MQSAPPENTAKTARHRPWLWLLAAGLGLLLVGVAVRVVDSHRAPEGNLSNSAIGREFHLVDMHGQPVTSASYAGKWRLMYFGYTYCPDICPTDTAAMAAALQQLRTQDAKAAAKLQPLFVTVDPERDTPAVLAEYLRNFDPEIIGLTGTRAQVDAALKTFRVYAAKVPGSTPDSYLYDHQALFYLMDPEGRPVQFLTGAGTDATALADMIRHFLG